ncbi:MAG: LamG-like jellyroll fold domain-containing protein [Verrucomicrobiota bacterium]
MKPFRCLYCLLALATSMACFSGTAQAQSLPDYSSYNWWHFEDTDWLSGAGYAPMSFEGLSSTNDGLGNSLLIDSTNAAWLRYNTVEEDGYTNLTVDRGTILFWFAPLWSSTNAGGSGPGEWSRLIEVGSYTTNASYGWWSLYTDPAGANIYFSAQTNGAAVDYLSAPITWTNNTWHHIGLTYSETNTTLYLDGNPATNGAALTVYPGPDVVAGGFLVGSSSNGFAQAHGMFDDLSTYDGPLDSGTIGGIAGIYSIFYDAPIAAEALNSASNTFSSLPTLNAITGSGFLQWLGDADGCVTSSDVWATNVAGVWLTNQTVSMAFSIQGGLDGASYDVFANAILGPSTSTNYLWAWMGQGLHCNRYQLNDLPLASAFVILGTPLDSDFDGLTDAYEKLVTRTDPLRPDSGLDGISDLYKLFHGMQPSVPLATPTLDSISLPVCPVP